MARKSPSRTGKSLTGARLAAPESFDATLRRSGLAYAAQPRLPSLAMRLIRVASGEFDVALARENSYDWDIAAADLILHEAGGVLTDLHGRTPSYNRADAETPGPGGGSSPTAGAVDRSDAASPPSGLNHAEKIWNGELHEP